jgi:hypothetical protein
MPFYAKSAGHVTRPYQGISLPKSKYPGYEVDKSHALTSLAILVTVLHMMNMREDYLIHNTHRTFCAWLLPLSLDNLNAISCTGCPPKKATIQISALFQTTYCIQFQRMQFHMIRSFSSSSMCIKLCMFLRIRLSKAIMNFKELQ